MTEHNHDCGCGHDHEHDHEHEHEVFTITDEEGVEREMVMVYSFECQENVYAVLLDKNDPEADGVIFRIEQEGEDAYLVNIDSDEEWNKVVAVYEQVVAGEQ